MDAQFRSSISSALKHHGWKCNTDEGMLMLLELMVKKINGCYNSYTESGFLNSMKVLRKDNQPNELGKKFMMHMLYASSNRKPPSFELMEKYRS